MTITQAMNLRAGDTLICPAANGHYPSGFRRYEVTAVDRETIELQDDYLSCTIRFEDASAKELLRLMQLVRQP